MWHLAHYERYVYTHCQALQRLHLLLLLPAELDTLVRTLAV